MTDKSSTKRDRPTPDSRWQGRLSISVTLATAIGLLVGVAVVIVLALGMLSALKNTRSLLSQNAQQAIAGASEQIAAHMRAAGHQTRFVAGRIAGGHLDPADKPALRRLMVGSFAAAPQINAMLYTDLELNVLRVVRQGADVEVTEYNGARTAGFAEAVAAVKARGKAYWGHPVRATDANRTLLNIRQPVFRQGKLVGVLFGVVSVREMSGYLDRLVGQDEGQLFLLYDRNYVLAHPVMSGGYAGLTQAQPLPALKGFSDPVLASIWQTRNRYPLFLDLPSGTNGHVLQIFNDEYIFVYRELKGFGDKPLLVGAHFRAGDVDEEMKRLARAGIAGLVVLLISLLAAIFVGRRIARPIKQLSGEAARIGELEISKVNDLPGSVFRELNDQSRAFNTMLRGLRWFEAYVPKRLVERLIERGEAGSLPSRDRDLTIMFTDIAGYTSLSEGAEAAEIAGLLNEHFATLAACIEAEGGTVDKFIGDSVMAFWGAPDKQKNRAERACRAAKAIEAALGDFNRQRDEAGKPPIRLRIGLHSGTVTVGNIGAPGRLNYTIVGDAVNVASRIESQGKEYTGEDDDVIILMSGDTRAHLGDGFEVEKVGQVTVRGREAPVELFRLL